MKNRGWGIMKLCCIHENCGFRLWQTKYNFLVEEAKNIGREPL